MERATKTTPATAVATLAALRTSARHARTGAGCCAHRDPRVAPPSAAARKNVTIAETCRFYGVQDTISTCRVPRSCQDCLRMPDCAITDGGVCQSVHDMKPTAIHYVNASNVQWDEFENYDYHKFLKSFPLGTAYNLSLTARGGAAYFYSANATYCAASDPVCTQCRAHFQAVASSADTVDQIRSQFCVGDGGCVCVALCEVPELLAVQANDTECGQQLVLPVKRYENFNRVRYSTTRRDPRAPPGLARTTTRKAHDKCAFYGYADLQGARLPRTCGDCIQKEGCMISLSGDGMCVGMDTYSPKLDFRTQWEDRYAPNSTTRKNYLAFPANSTSYCPASDRVCASCRKTFNPTVSKSWDDWYYRSKATHCIGEGGCVCIEQCEANAVYPDYDGCQASRANQPIDETCEYYGVLDARGCRQPRNCTDCLDKDGCMLGLNDKFQCTSIDKYSARDDFRTETKFDVHLFDAIQFPSNATTFCSAVDPVCSFCREQFRIQPGSRVNMGIGGSLYFPTVDTSFCIGRDGCVCIERCENATLLMEDARDTSYKLGSTRSDANVAIAVTAVVVLLPILIYLVREWIRKHRADTRSEDTADSRPAAPAGMLRHMLDQAPALHLDLYGWRRFQDVLLMKEQELLAGAGDVSPVFRPVDFVYEAVPTAPDFDEEDDPTAPTATNPHALASAPADHHPRTSEPNEPSPFVPSAPDFDLQHQ